MELRGHAKQTGIHVTVHRTGHPGRTTKAHIHRSDICQRIDVVNASSPIPLTRPERAVIGCAELEPNRTAAAIDAAVLRRRTTYDRLWRYLSHFGGPGCPGSAAVKEVLMRRDPRSGPTESDLEDAWIAALADHGVVGLVAQLPVETEDGTLRIDLGHPVHPIGLEFDSRIWHSSEEDYRRERRKRYPLAKAGYRIFPVTEFDLHERVPDIATDVLDTIAAADAAWPA